MPLTSTENNAVSYPDRWRWPGASYDLDRVATFELGGAQLVVHQWMQLPLGQHISRWLKDNGFASYGPSFDRGHMNHPGALAVAYMVSPDEALDGEVRTVITGGRNRPACFAWLLVAVLGDNRCEVTMYFDSRWAELAEYVAELLRGKWPVGAPPTGGPIPLFGGPAAGATMGPMPSQPLPTSAANLAGAISRAGPDTLASIWAATVEQTAETRRLADATMTANYLKDAELRHAGVLPAETTQDAGTASAGGRRTNRVGRAPRLPSRLPERRRWIATWAAVRTQWESAKVPTTGRGTTGTYGRLADWLRRTKPDLACSAETLRDIIHAGEAGQLERPV